MNATPSAPRAALAGVAGAAVSLGAGELLAGLLLGVPSPVVAVGEGVIEVTPPTLERAAVALFGLADKLALNTGTVVLALASAAGLGVAGRRLRWVATLGWGAFGTLGVVAALAQPEADSSLVVVGYTLAAAAGLVALHRLLWRARDEAVALEGGRRRFLAATARTFAVAAVGAVGGRFLVVLTRSTGRGSVGPFPAAARTADPPGPAASFDVPGVTPVVVPNDDFYRIDTALFVPRVAVDDWRLAITGLVDRELTLTYDDVLAMDLVESYVTIACVSNEVGGDLVGNALWLGVPLGDVLDRAGVRPEATQLVGRSVDGFTAGFPVEAASDGRGALLAIGMNGEPLPVTHGFPARLVVPGLYGYVSATKWLAELELTTFDAFDAYWIRRGWARFAPIETQSRIDVPRGGTVPSGGVDVAGVAWAPDLGIERVEVRVDGGAWDEAEVSAPLSDDAWVQWRYRWEATPGEHTLEVRATDGTGTVQVEEPSPPFPDGATGYHAVRVTAA